MKKIYISLCFLSLSAFADRLSLSQMISEALEKSPQLGEQSAQLEVAKAQESLARAKGLMGAKLETLVGPIPGAEGTAAGSKTKWDDWGPFVSNTLDIWQPIYAFGSLSSAREAGKAGVNAEEKLLERDRWKLRYDIAELYYGYQLAYELAEMGQDFVSKLEIAYKKIGTKNTKSRQVLYNLTELKTQVAEALKSKQQAKMAMGWKLGRQSDDNIQWDQSNLIKRQVSESKIQDWKKNFTQSRPEWQALENEVVAKKALAEVDEGLAWPQVFIFARGQYNEASNRVNSSKGPFAYDSTNTKYAAAGLGLRWNLALFENSAQRSKTRAEAKKAEAKKSYLQAGLLLEAEKTIGDFKQRQEALELREKADQEARESWKESMISFGLKNLAPEKLFQAMADYGIQHKKYLEAIYQYNLMSYKLEQNLGQEIQ
jgi:outer membrane protein TolC